MPLAMRLDSPCNLILTRALYPQVLSLFIQKLKKKSFLAACHKISCGSNFCTLQKRDSMAKKNFPSVQKKKKKKKEINRSNGYCNTDCDIYNKTPNLIPAIGIYKWLGGLVEHHLLSEVKGDKIILSYEMFLTHAKKPNNPF